MPGRAVEPRGIRKQVGWFAVTFAVVCAVGMVSTVFASAAFELPSAGTTEPPVGTIETAASPPVSSVTVIPYTADPQFDLRTGTPSVPDVLDSYDRMTNPTYPSVITGSSASPQWANFSNLLELAPATESSSDNNQWATGLAMFPFAPGLTVSLQANVTYSYPAQYGPYGQLADGVEAYLFVTPIGQKNWSLHYYGSSDGNSTLYSTAQGAVILPYSTTPYIAIQWDPWYQWDSYSTPANLSHDNFAPTGDFNLFMVRPNTTSGAVNNTNVLPVSGDLGSGHEYLPRPGDVLNFVVNYSVETSSFSAEVLDLSHPVISFQYSANLASSYGFSPGEGTHGSYYFGLGGSANQYTSWGALSLAAIGSPVPKGDWGVALLSSPAPCGEWYGDALGDQLSAVYGTNLAVAQGATVYLTAAPSCPALSWDPSAGGVTGPDETFSSWSTDGDARLAAGDSAGSATIGIKPDGSGAVTAVYSAPSNPITLDPGWVGYNGNTTIYPTRDPTPFIVQAQSTGNYSQVESGKSWQSLSNNSIADIGMPLYEYNVSAQQFQLFVTNTVDSSVSEPCYYASLVAASAYNPEVDTQGDQGTYACYPVALMESAEHIRGVPSDSLTNVTGIFGSNISTKTENTTTWDGYLPQGINGTSVNIAPWAIVALDLFSLGADADGLDSLPEGAPFVIGAEQLGWDAHQLGDDLLTVLTPGGLPMTLLQSGVHELFPFLNGTDVRAITDLAVSLMFAGALCAFGGPIGCAVGIAVAIVSAILQMFGLYIGIPPDGPWNGISLDSVPAVRGDGTVRDWVRTNDNLPQNGSSTDNRSLLWCPWSNFYAQYCGNNTYQEGMITETAINGSELNEISPGSVSVSGTNQLWRFLTTINSGVANGSYDNLQSDCNYHPPCAPVGAATPGLTYGLMPAVSIGGTVTTSGNLPEKGANVTLSEIYHGATTVYTTTTNGSGYWHFFARPGATYTYNVTPLGSPTSVQYLVADSDTAVQNAGANVILPAVEYTPALSAVVFTAQALPPGATWQVWLNSSVGGLQYGSSSTGGSMVVWAPNGTYSWVAAYTGEPRTTAHPFAMGLTVNGGESVTVGFPTTTVELAEHSLPPGLRWGAWVNSTTVGGPHYQVEGAAQQSLSTVSGVMVPGTYSYSWMVVPGYHVVHGAHSGTVKVRGKLVGVAPIRFGQWPFGVTFSETGLALLKGWSVTLYNSTTHITKKGTGNGKPLVFSEPNGTYSFSVTVPKGWQANPYSGSITVTGAAPLPQNIAFTDPPEFPVTLSESGLPPGTNWLAAVGNFSNSSAASNSVIVNQPNGTYPWSVPSVSGFTLANSSGSTTVSGAGSVVHLTFVPLGTAANVSFSAQGLPPGSPWLVWLNSTSGGPQILTSSSTPGVSVSAPSGTYTYWVSSPTGYNTSLWTGSLSLSSGTLAVPLPFNATFPVQLQQTGLGPGTQWTGWLVPEAGGLTDVANSTGSSLSFAASNGTYTWWMDPVPGFSNATNLSGNVTVDGAAASTSVSFFPFSTLHPVTFNETGLPAGTSWTVTLNASLNSSCEWPVSFCSPNATQVSNHSSLSFEEESGAFNWSVGPIPGFNGTLSGNLSFAQAPVYVTVAFIPQNIVPTVALLAAFHATPDAPYGNYSLKFTVPTSAGPGTSHELLFWTVGGTCNGVVPAPLPRGMVVAASTGVGGVAVGSVRPGNYTISISCSAWVNTVTIAAYGVFNDLGAYYDFDAIGQQSHLTLPAGATFYLGAETTGGTYSVTSPSLSTISTEAGALNGGNTGLIGLQSADQYAFSTQAVGYGIIAAGIYTGHYYVNFTESGLPSGTSWSASLNGTTRSTSSSTISFVEPNGTFNYAVNGVAGYTPSTRSGLVAVAGSARFTTITWAVTTYGVDLIESGLASGVTWSVTFAGSVFSNTVNLPPPPGKPTGWVIYLSEANGSYPFTAGALAGYSGSPASGTVSVNGASVDVTITYSTTYKVTFTESGLPSGTSWSVTVGGTKQSSTSTSTVFWELPGNYTYTVGTVTGYTVAPASGTLTVTSSGLSVAVTYKTSGGGGGGCVSNGTPILTPSGYVPVQDLRPGDPVDEFSFQTDSLFVGYLISAAPTGVSQLVDLNDGWLLLTLTEQPVYVLTGDSIGWVHDPQDLSVGDRVLDPVNLTWILLTSVQIVHQRAVVFDVVTSGANNFVGAGALLDLKSCESCTIAPVQSASSNPAAPNVSAQPVADRRRRSEPGSG